MNLPLIYHPDYIAPHVLVRGGDGDGWHHWLVTLVVDGAVASLVPNGSEYCRGR